MLFCVRCMTVFLQRGEALRHYAGKGIPEKRVAKEVNAAGLNRLAKAGKACTSCLIAVHRFNARGNSCRLGKVVGDDVLRVREIVAQ